MNPRACVARPLRQLRDVVRQVGHDFRERGRPAGGRADDDHLGTGMVDGAGADDSCAGRGVSVRARRRRTRAELARVTASASFSPTLASSWLRPLGLPMTPRRPLRARGAPYPFPQPSAYSP